MIIFLPPRQKIILMMIACTTHEPRLRYQPRRRMAQPYLCDQPSLIPVDPIRAHYALESPFAIPKLPLATVPRQLVAGEVIFGARVAAAQLPIISGWRGSCASLGTALLIVVPLLKLRYIAVGFHALLAPAATIPALCLGLVDEAAVVLAALVTSVVGAFATIITGAPILDAGPRLVVSVSRSLRSSQQARLIFGAFLAFVWRPVKEEVIFRAGVQRQLALLFQSKAASATAEASGDDAAAESAVSTGEVEQGGVAVGHQRARLITSILFAVAHLPTSSRVIPLVIALPVAVASGLSSYYCFGVLYERRGLPSCIGAHAAHNLFVTTLHSLQGRTTGLLYASGLGFVAPIVPAAIYANYFYRLQMRRTVRATQQPEDD